MKKMLILLISALFAAGTAGCNSLEKGHTDSSISESIVSSEAPAYESDVQTEIEKIQIEEQIIDILNSTQVNPPFALTIGQAVVNVFTNYDYEIKPYYATDDSVYLIAFTGTYKLNPDVPVVKSGTISYKVNLKPGECKVVSDTDEILTAFYVYSVS